MAELREITLKTGLKLMNENTNPEEEVNISEQETQQVNEEPQGDNIKENEGGEKVQVGLSTTEKFPNTSVLPNPSSTGGGNPRGMGEHTTTMSTQYTTTTYSDHNVGWGNEERRGRKKGGKTPQLHTK